MGGAPCHAVAYFVCIYIYQYLVFGMPCHGVCHAVHTMACEDGLLVAS